MPAPAPIPETDFSLLRRFAEEGDEDAFSEIVRRYAGVVFSACHRVLRDKGWAEDVAQETFFRLVKGPDRVSHSLGGWLHRAATRLAVDTLRSERARHRREQTYESPAAEQDNDPGSMGAGGAFGGSAWQEVSPAIDEALDELDDESRELLVRHFLQGTAQADLAEEAAVSAATMSRRVKHAVNDLRQRLAKRGVTLAPSVLLLLCARNAAEAAPVALMGQLGKMAMVSGGATKAGVLSAANCIPSWAASIPSPLKIVKVAAQEWPRISLCAAVGLGLYLAIPYYPFMRFVTQNHQQPASVREDVPPGAGSGAASGASSGAVPQRQRSAATMPQTVPSP
jgi:RNA polymerase sigma-70 factor (ECF subfamily)